VFVGLTEAGKEDQGLAPKTVRNIHNILHRALKGAVRWGYLVRNVTEAADPPNGKSAEMRVWSPDQLRAFLLEAGRLAMRQPRVVVANLNANDLPGARDQDSGDQTMQASL
jgi:hypothetical protein